MLVVLLEKDNLKLSFTLLAQIFLFFPENSVAEIHILDDYI